MTAHGTPLNKMWRVQYQYRYDIQYSYMKIGIGIGIVKSPKNRLESVSVRIGKG